MTIEKTRAHIASSVWRAIAQSGVDLSALPLDQQNKLVDSVTNSLLVEVDEMLGELSQASRAAEPTVELEGDEHVVWQGRPFLSLVENYTITSERIKITKGLFGREIENFELIRLQDIDFSQNLGERMLGIGDVVIKGHDASDPAITLRNVKEPEKVYEILRRAWLDARKRYGLTFQEEM